MGAMSETFLVHGDELADAALRVSSISPDVHELRRGAGRHGHAAEGTHAARGMSDLAEHWAAVLPGFAAAGSGLVSVLAAAAGEYRRADGFVAAAAVSVPAGQDR